MGSGTCALNVEIPTSSIWLAEVEVFPGFTNLGLHNPASQSSAVSSLPCETAATADKAVHGNASGTCLVLW